MAGHLVGLSLVAQEIDPCGASDGLALFGSQLHKCLAIGLIQRFKFLETLVAGQNEDLVGTGQNAVQLFLCLQLILGIVFQLLTFLTNLSADTLPGRAGSVSSAPLRSGTESV